MQLLSFNTVFIGEMFYTTIKEEGGRDREAIETQEEQAARRVNV